jgi:hypothetical protein
VLAALVLGILIGASAGRDDEAGRSPLTMSSAPTTSTVVTVATVVTAPPPSTRPPGEVRVLVLNGAEEAGVAGTLSDGLAGRGFAMAPPADVAPHPQTTVYSRAGEEADCEAVGVAVQELRGETPVVVPLLEPPQIPGADGMSCVVVVGRSFA